jgi:hypothetical protein
VLYLTAGDKNTVQISLQFPECVDVSKHPDMLISAAALRHTKLISSPSLALLPACRSLPLQDTINQMQNMKSRVSHFSILVPVGYTFSDYFHHTSVQFTDSSFSLIRATYENIFNFIP